MSLGFTGPRKLNETSNMPQVGVALQGWKDPLYLIKTTQVMDEGLSTEVESKTKFSGTVQPLSAKQIALKPEGQRAFQWLRIHVVSGELDLDVNDKIMVGSETFKIMNKWPWKRSGYNEYHAVEEFT